MDQLTWHFVRGWREKPAQIETVAQISMLDTTTESNILNKSMEFVAFGNGETLDFYIKETFLLQWMVLQTR
jgi:hypothetical protein